LTHIRLKWPNRLPDLLVPVPMAYWPAVKRGFNQARLLADCLGRELDLPVAHTLLTRRLGPSQRSLSRAERRGWLRIIFDGVMKLSRMRCAENTSPWWTTS
jgi:predicted amidophosphoribosyltransferase